MTFTKSITLALAIITLAAPPMLARLDVKIDFDKTFNFKAARTWGWKAADHGQVMMARTQTDDPEEMRKAIDPIVVDAVTTEMKRIGLTPAPANPDVSIAYFVLLTMGQQAQTMGQFLPGANTWGLPPFPAQTTSLKFMNQGALVLDLSANQAVVWRGVAQAEIKMDLEWKKREALLRQAVRDLLRRYPPK